MLLRAHRVAARLSQQELSRMAGIGERTIRDLESGRARRPHPPTVVDLARALGLGDRDRDRLLRAARPGPSEPPAEAGPPSGPGPLSDTAAPPEPVEPVGRAAEVDLVTAAATRGVVVVTGQAGVGKSALALHAARRLGGEVHYLDLCPVRTAGDDPLRRLLHGVGVPPEEVPGDADERRDLLRARTAEGTGVLVLDDAAAEAQVRPLLPGGRGWAVLVTSRGPLAGLAHAHRVVVDPLRPDDARRLLERAAGTAVPAELVDACRGLPLVLLAAARLVAEGGPGHALERLRDERALLDLLDGPRSGLRGSLRAAYERTGPAGRVLLRRLALLPEGDHTVAEVAAPTGCAEAEELLEALVDVGLVRSAAGRYAVPHLARLFAAEQAAVEDPR
ncbi:helix-turn-helix domain-containing protein [Actinosynnema sp. NPDC053489]|uniref:helix-turn-helix domain-containing protein n=1 Tax=Actinosynnema sp. NPDC053489 TaxID=3363916 RepID=UPI0037C6CD65